MSKFGDLLRKSEKKPQHEITVAEMPDQSHTIQQNTLKKNAFANLKKTVATVSPVATAGEGGLPPEVLTPSPTSFKFNLEKQKTKISDTAVVASPPPCKPQSKTGVVDPMQETTAPSFSETEAAKDFQSADQPDTYNDKHVEEFKQALDILKNSIDNKELIADALKHIMVNLKRHVFLQDILLPEDCQLMVRGLRESYGVTIAKKQTKRTKKETNSQDVDAVLDQLADLDMQI